MAEQSNTERKEPTPYAMGKSEERRASLKEVENRLKGVQVLLHNIAAAASDPIRLATGDFHGAIEIAFVLIESIIADLKAIQEEE